MVVFLCKAKFIFKNYFAVNLILNFLTCFLTSGLKGKTKGLARHIAFSILDLNFWSSLSRKIICSISPVSLKKTLTLALIPTEEGGTFQILKIFF